MDDQLRVLDELEKLVGNVTKTRLVDKEFIGDAVNRDRPFINLTIGLQIDMVVTPSQAATDDLDTTDLDDPVAIGDWHTRGFGIEYYAAHVVSLTYTMGCRLA